MSNSIDISVIVPVYNGNKCLIELFERTQKTLVGMNKTFQVIFVDDFSSDNSWNVIQELKKIYTDNVVGIKLAKNFGQHNATLCGIEHSIGDYIVTIDDDLEFSPEDIALLIAKQIETKDELIYGVDLNKKQSTTRKLFSKLYKSAAKIVEGNDKCTGSSFRLIKKSLAKSILQHQRIFSFIDEFLIWHTAKISIVNVTCKDSMRGKSRYSFWGLISMTKELILFNSIAPLRIVTTIGSLMIFTNLFFGLIILYRKLILSIHVEGYTSLIIAILFSSGVIIFSLGIIAEYISKLIKMSYGQPAYKEEEILN